jgi:hypothetical protein
MGKQLRFCNILKYFKSVNYVLGIGDWGLGPIPNPQSPKIELILT